MRGFNLKPERGEHADGDFAIQRLIFDHQNAAREARAASRQAASMTMVLAASGCVSSEQPISAWCNSREVQRLGELDIEERVPG